jgi:glutathione S-transferase
MKLYYSTGSCSLSPRIALHEAGLAHEGVLAPTKTKVLPDGSDFRALTPKGYVPMLELDNGDRLTEGVAIVQYIADQAPASGLAPAAGTMARYRLQEWLTFISSELHKSYSPWLWHKETAQPTKESAKAMIHKRLTELDGLLAKQPYLTGDQFTVADAYAFTIINWSNFLHMSLQAYPCLLYTSDAADDM